MTGDGLQTSVVETSYAALTAGSRTFRFASYFLPRDCRDDAAVVYAFCRLVDDLADDAPSPETARLDLEQVLRELRGQAASRALVHAFRTRMAHAPGALAAAEELIEGVLSDQNPVRVADDAELLRYAYRVAGTVGLMMCAVLGVRDPAAFPHAVDLGVAMQLTNICRDVREDARMGRVYLPADRLLAAGTSTSDLLDGTPSPEAVAHVVNDLLAMAEGYYASADAGMRYIPSRARLAIVVASRTYRAIGKKLARNGYDAWAGRTVVGSAEKVGWMLLALGQSAGPRIAGWGRRPQHDATLHAPLAGLPGTNGLLLGV